jgi:hypothetical protein
MEEERFKEIERENKILLQKMKRIMEGGGYRTQTPFEKKSLNKEARKQKLIDITMANQALLKRLQDKQSNYDVLKWEQERIQNKKLVKRIGLFSSTTSETALIKPGFPILKRPRQTTTRLSKRRIKKDYQAPLNFISPEYLPKTRAKTTRRKHKRTLTTQLPLDIAALCSLPEGRTVLLTEEKMMGGGRHAVEISKTQDKMFLAAAKVNKHSENYTIELEFSKGDQIIYEFGGDLNKIYENLQIINRRLVLLNPKIGGESKKKKKGMRMSNSQSNLEQQQKIEPLMKPTEDNFQTLQDQKENDALELNNQLEKTDHEKEGDKNNKDKQDEK